VRQFDPASCVHILVMGPAGSGKSSVAAALARELGFEMIEGDDHHPSANVEKMVAGIPLTDADRRPWLEALAALVADRHQRGESTVLASSALRRAYRDILRSAIPPEESFVVELTAGEDTLRDRLATRTGHYMPVTLLESQLATLEHLADDETGVRVDASRSLEVVIAEALSAVRSMRS
jgi:gluconokinase